MPLVRDLIDGNTPTSPPPHPKASCRPLGVSPTVTDELGGDQLGGAGEKTWGSAGQVAGGRGGYWLK